MKARIQGHAGNSPTDFFHLHIKQRRVHLSRAQGARSWSDCQREKKNTPLRTWGLKSLTWHRIQGDILVSSHSAKKSMLPSICGPAHIDYNERGRNSSVRVGCPEISCEAAKETVARNRTFLNDERHVTPAIWPIPWSFRRLLMAWRDDEDWRLLMTWRKWEDWVNMTQDRLTRMYKQQRKRNLNFHLPCALWIDLGCIPKVEERDN